MLRISPQGLVFIASANFFKATSDIFMLIFFELQNSSFYRGGMTTGYLMQLSAQQHFNTRQINPFFCKFITL